MTNPDNLYIFTDGAAKGNPGPGGFGVVIASPKMGEVVELGGSKPSTTNNEMELAAMVAAFSYIANNTQVVQVYTDSSYVLQGATAWRHGWKRNGWKTKEDEPIKNLRDWQMLSELLDERKTDVRWTKVPSHFGIIGNERADTIASDFAEGKNPTLFRGMLNRYDIDVLDIPADSELEAAIAEKHSKKPPKEGYYIGIIDGKFFKTDMWNEMKEKVEGKKGVKFKKVANEDDEKKQLEAWGFQR